MSEPRVVCAAMLMDDGLVVAGARHYSPDMRAVLHRLYGDGYHRKVKTQGFIDSKGAFLTREEAWVRAKVHGQILPGPVMHERLFSEHLY